MKSSATIPNSPKEMPAVSSNSIFRDSSATSSIRFITIRDRDVLEKILTPCQKIELNQLLNLNIQSLIGTMQDALKRRIPALQKEPLQHSKPAYLAANQIGLDKSIVLLYLPPEDKQEGRFLTLLNPYYAGDAQDDESSENTFSLSTFFAEQLRFHDHNYFHKVTVFYRDVQGNERDLVLTGINAKAAQMGIDFVYGRTPLDYISDTELKVFNIMNGKAKIDPQDTIATTTNVYLHLGRQSEINMEDYQFSPSLDQLNFIDVYLKARQKYPLNVNEDQTQSPQLATCTI